MPKDSFPIPQTNLPVGVTTFGPSTAHSTMQTASISIDRTVANGLNSRPATTRLVLDTQFSFDGGANWASYTTTSLQGGAVPDDQGNPVATHIETEEWNPPIARGTRVRVVCTVTGTPVTVVGSVTITG